MAERFYMLAVELVRSLFCGLPRQDKRMAVFVAAADESSDRFQQTSFYYSGFVGPEEDWYNSFAAAWDWRVLSGPPRIPYLHMTEIHTQDYRIKYGLSDCDANRRIDNAFDVINSMGSIVPVGYRLSFADFNPAIQGKAVLHEGAKQSRRYPMEPDYICFVAFAYLVLQYVATVRPECEKVDFVIERNGKISHRINDFYDSVKNALTQLGHESWMNLLGDLIPAGKDRTPLQAADLLCWYSRKLDAGELSRFEQYRFYSLAMRAGRFGTYTGPQIHRIMSMGDDIIGDYESGND